MNVRDLLISDLSDFKIMILMFQDFKPWPEWDSPKMSDLISGHNL